MDGSQITVDGRDALRFERRLPHSVERVWRAVSEPAELERWFPATVPWGPTEGETFEAAGEPGRVTTVRAPHELAWEWSIDRYSFELSADGDGCLLVFTHVFNPEHGPGHQHAAGWAIYFRRLDAHLDGGFLSEEEAHAQFDALMARYRSEFGAG